MAPHEHPLELTAITEGSCQGVPLGGTLHGQAGTEAALLHPKTPEQAAAAAAGGDAWGNPASSSAAGAGLDLHGKSQGFPRANSPAPHSEHPILQITRYLQRVRAKNNGRLNPSCLWEIGRATRRARQRDGAHRVIKRLAVEFNISPPHWVIRISKCYQGNTAGAL